MICEQYYKCYLSIKYKSLKGFYYSIRLVKAVDEKDARTKCIDLIKCDDDVKFITFIKVLPSIDIIRDKKEWEYSKWFNDLMVEQWR